MESTLWMVIGDWVRGGQISIFFSLQGCRRRVNYVSKNDEKASQGVTLVVDWTIIPGSTSVHLR